MEQPKPDVELAERMVTFLNELLKLDPKAINSLINARVPCDALIDHPTVQVRLLANEGAQVGIIGILNGLCGVWREGRHLGSGPIAAERYPDRDAIKQFVIQYSPAEEVGDGQEA